MTTFDAYSNYYDLLYKDKDYKSEISFVDRLIKRYHQSAQTILDLGCGTGNHDFGFVKQGYSVTGIDCSEKNIEIASSKLNTAAHCDDRLEFQLGDIRTIRLKQKFDAIVSLFHVFSYQTSNNDLSSAFSTAEAHLKTDGIFIFDCWYGPAVLSQKPATRIKEVENERIKIIRHAVPELVPNENVVKVNYHLIAQDKISRKYSETRETHRMRYLFLPEIEHFLKTSGLILLDAAAWMTGAKPGLDTWGIYLIARMK